MTKPHWSPITLGRIDWEAITVEEASVLFDQPTHNLFADEAILLRALLMLAVEVDSLRQAARITGRPLIQKMNADALKAERADLRAILAAG